MLLQAVGAVQHMFALCFLAVRAARKVVHQGAEGFLRQ